MRRAQPAVGESTRTMRSSTSSRDRSPRPERQHADVRNALQAHERARLAIAIVGLALIAAGEPSCTGSDAARSGTTYVVTVSTLARPQDIAELQRSLEHRTAGTVRVTRVSPIAYTMIFSSMLDAEAKESIERSMDDSPIVCGHCETGTGCLDVIMKKPGCGGH